MVVLAEIDKAPDPASTDLVEAQAGNTHELAASGYDRSFAVIVGHRFVSSSVAAREYTRAARKHNLSQIHGSPPPKNEQQITHDAAHRTRFTS